MSALLELASLCEAATDPDRALDGVAYILTNPDKPWIVGHEPGRFPQKPIYGTLSDYLGWATGLCGEVDLARRADVADSIGAPAYTASIDAAMTLKPDGWMLNGLCELNDGTGQAAIRKGNPSLDTFGRVASTAATPALALVAACLRARASQEQSHD